MPRSAFEWNRQKAGWARLKGLHPTAIDLRRVARLRSAAIEELVRPERLEVLLAELGLNDEALAEFPTALHAHCGHGLRLWQYPLQFSKYLVQLARLGVRSYLEIGIRHGGSFVTTAEYLERFAPLDFAVGVDIIPCPAMAHYQVINPKAQFWCENTRTPAFAARLDQLGPIDLVFVDSHHEEAQCRTELELLAERAAILAFHDISNIGCPGVGRVWQVVKAMPAYECHEFVEQYPDLGPFMGIGLAIKRQRLRPPESR
jgi:cephalosporin hydroxylase